MIELNKVYQGDCLEVMKEIDNNSVDLILTDPPYNIAKSRNIFKIGNKITDTKTSFGHYDTYDSKDYLYWIEKLIKEFYRVLKDGSNIIIFLGRENVNIIEKIFESNGFKYKNTICIVKKNPLPHFRKNGLRSGFELGLWLVKGDKCKTFNFLRQDLMINYDLYTIGDKDTAHPNEKPLNIIEKYLLIMSNKNDTILDPFIGSGTTAVACERLQRNWIGIEREQEYIDIANTRINKYKEQRRLF